MPTIAKYKEQLLNEFESKVDNWSFGNFENRLKEIKPDASYHDAKSIMIEAHKVGKWPKTVKRYLITNYKTHGNVSSELGHIFNQVYLSLSADEKKFWDIE